MKLLAALSSIAEPLITNNTGVAEDATVFVNFLHSVNNGKEGVTESLFYLYCIFIGSLVYAHPYDPNDI